MTPAKRALHIALWVAQGLLAAGFGFAGVIKGFTPMDEVVKKIAWAGDLPPLLVRFIGLCELSGAIGMIVPSVTRMRPALTPLAGAGLVLVMILAAGFHIIRGEFSAVPINASLGALAAFVVWGRAGKVPLSPRPF